MCCNKNIDVIADTVIGAISFWLVAVLTKTVCLILHGSQFGEDNMNACIFLATMIGALLGAQGNVYYKPVRDPNRPKYQHCGTCLLTLIRTVFRVCTSATMCSLPGVLFGLPFGLFTMIMHEKCLGANCYEHFLLWAGAGALSSAIVSATDSLVYELHGSHGQQHR